MEESTTIRVSMPLRDYLTYLKDLGHYETYEELIKDNLDKMSVTCDQRHKKFTEIYQYYGGIKTIAESDKEEGLRLQNPATED